MTPLQWALLIFGGGIVVYLVYSGWRDKKELERSRMKPEEPPRPRFGQDWQDGAGSAKPGAGGATGSFDEFGVSKPRRLAPDGSTRGQAPETGKPEVKVDLSATVPQPMPPPASVVRPAKVEPVAAAPRAPAKLIAFYIAEHEGTTILGPKIHDALEARGLKFGAKKIYHRTHNGQPVFSVASLTKPGTLDPSEAEGFSTPGLSVFMQLPVAIPAVAAFEDMLSTAKSLARDLNAELFDSERQALLTPERERELHAQVQEWARQHIGG